MKDLKQRTIRGGAAKIGSQAANFALRIGTLMILARLLDPKDFGLVGMVTAVIGVFSVFRDFGLSAAAVQRATVTEEQASTLFWINILVGLSLSLLTLAIAPFVAAFYHEKRLLGVTAVLATAFLFNAAGVQQTSFLERQMRFTTISALEIFSLFASTVVGIIMATHGAGYWSLVATTTLTPFFYSIAVWLATKWIPGRPRKNVGIGSMIRFGGTLTLNGFIMFLASNFEKVLLGRYWGVEALGIYGRAYQLSNIPTENLNSAVGGVAFAALSRLQGEPSRLRTYFLKGYTLTLSLTVPITFTCALFADEIVQILLGPKWKSAAIVFRLLAPTTLAFAILNPLGWLMSSLGLVERALKIALVLGPAMIVAYVMGLPSGPKGVATAYSAVMMLSAVPLIVWVTRGTMISVRDILLVIGRPLLSGIVAALIALGLQFLYGRFFSALSGFAIGVTVYGAVYLTMLLHVMGQKPFYSDLFREFQGRASTEKRVLASS
jgi:PST family polysaccharide transporter